MASVNLSKKEQEELAHAFKAAQLLLESFNQNIIAGKMIELQKRHDFLVVKKAEVNCEKG